MDKREQVIVRLLAIASGIDGIVTAVRNTDTISERNRPGIIVFDGDEAVELSENAPKGPAIVAMTPEIVIVLGDTAAEVGTTLNAYRAAFLKAVLTDATLRGIVGTNGGVSYQGCAIALARGRNMEGEMGISLSITYPLNPAAL